MPSLSEMCDLFVMAPELPLPKPRDKTAQALQRGSKTQPLPARAAKPSSIPPSSANDSSSVAGWMYSIAGYFKRLFAKDVTNAKRVGRPNPFQMLKLGKKMIVVAAVDCGVISFYRFGQGIFEEWPMI